MLTKRTFTSNSAKSRINSFNHHPPAFTKFPGKLICNINNSTPEQTEAETTINVPHIKIKDNGRLLPRYSAALERAKDEYLPAEDLDNIQFELESLLTNVALRYRVLKCEYELIDRDERRLDRRSRPVHDKHPIPSGKRKRDESRKPKIPHFKLTKQKIMPAHSPAQSHHTDDSMDALPYFHYHQPKDHPKVALLKNDIPNKFWLSIEPYCMPITNEDVRLLDDMLGQYSDPLVPPTPDLGPHYSTTWAVENLKNEKCNSNKNLVNAKSKVKNGTTNKIEVTSLLRKGHKLMGQSVTGPLTQRLVSVLLEDNLMGDIMNVDSNSSSEHTNSTSSSMYPLSVLKNGIELEKRVKCELINQGLIDAEECIKPEEDEIFIEISRVNAELSAIAEYNGKEIRHLKEAAKCELRRLEIKRKLDAVDQDILDVYKRMVQAKQRRRSLTNEEQDEIYRLTIQQKRLSDQLDRTPNPGRVYSQGLKKSHGKQIKTNK